MAKIPEASARMFTRVFVCKRCKKKIRADPIKIRAKKIVCRVCGSKHFRPKTKEKKIRVAAK